MQKTGLQVLELSKSYQSGGGENKVLKKISFTAKDNETIAITGPSGSGKSTLLSILGSLETADSGELWLGSINVARLAGKELYNYRNKTVGFVFQEHFLLPQCTALENVLLPAIPAGEGRKLKKRGGELLVLLGLSGKLDSFPSQLSGGEKQRVAIARALLNSPKLLLCDEPTGNLDAVNAKKAADIFVKLAAKEEVTVVMATHNKELLKNFTAVYAIDNGSLKKVKN